MHITSPGIVELGCGTDPDPRSETRLDVRDLDPVNRVHDLDDLPWPFEDGGVEGIIMHHVLEHLDDVTAIMEEVSRILEPGGWAEIRVPFGGAWFRDPTHESFWTYSTPEYFATDEEHEWDYYFDLPLVLEDRSFTALWFMPPLLSKLSPLLRALASRYPGDWVCMAPMVSGELTVRYLKRSSTES